MGSRYPIPAPAERVKTVWDIQLENEPTVDAVLATVRDYLDSLGPGELAGLPPAYRPTRIRDEDDLEGAIVQLAYAKRRASEGCAGAILNRLLRASMRISQLGSPAA